MENQANKVIISKVKDRFVEIVDENTFKKEMSFAIQILDSNSYLDKATPESKMKAVVNVAMTGLTLNPVLNHAYLVPRRMNGVIECTLMPSYQGLIHLIMNAGGVKKVGAHVVRDGDDFEYSLGLRPDIIHRPKCESGCEITSAYAYAEMENGSVFVEVMNIEELHQVRSMSESYKGYERDNKRQTPWVQWESEMFRKTVVKRLSKYLPKIGKWEAFQTAVEVDNEDYKASVKSISYIESLLSTASIPPEQRDVITRSLHYISQDDAIETIEMLKENQINLVQEGKANQAEITNHIAEISGVNQIQEDDK